MDGQEGEREMEATYFVGGRIPMCENPEKTSLDIHPDPYARIVRTHKLLQLASICSRSALSRLTPNKKGF